MIGYLLGNALSKCIGANRYFRWILLPRQRYYHKKALKKIKKKEHVNICFFLTHDSVWKYEGIYKLFQKDERFNPVVLVCPYIVYGDNNMHNEMDKAYKTFKDKGYNVLKSLKQDGTWVDVKTELKPDIIFFTNPHKITISQYYIYNFKEYLTCYVPYNFGNSHLLNMFHNQDFHNLIWKLFAETEIHNQYSKDISRNKGKNVVVTGFPGTDSFIASDNHVHNNHIWKHENTKKIIWAPHHTIDDDKSFISFSSFIVYYEFMLELLNTFNSQIEIIFKPHPLLKSKLYNDENWGKEKTDLYYELWKNHPYGGLNEGEYVELFKTSDAMIHDSGSFLTEYLYTLKPVLRTDRDSTITERLNDFGKMAYNKHYIAKNKDEIQQFIQVVVLENLDKMKANRIEFYNTYLLPPNNRLASENIFNFIKSEIK